MELFIIVADYLHILIPVVVVLVFGVIAVVTVVRKVKTSQSSEQWNEAVKNVADQMGLKHFPIPSHFDRASGDIGAHDVDLSVDVESKGSGVVYLFTIEVDLSIDWQFYVKRRGIKLRFEEMHAGEPTPSGIPEIDGSVELLGAPAPILQALQNDAEFQALFKQVFAEWGATLSRRELKLQSPKIPETAEEIIGYMGPMVDLARRLEDPNASHDGPALGTAAAGAVRRYDHASEEEKPQILQAFLQGVGEQLGQGQAYANPNDREVQWQGTVDGVPLRIKADIWPSAIIEAKVQNPHGTIVVEYDPEKVPQPGAPPAWDESDTQRVFLSRGVFIEGDAQDVDVMVRRLRSLPPEVGQTIAEALEHSEGRVFMAEDQRIRASFRPEITEMLDPEGQISHMARVVAWVAAMLQTSPLDPQVAQMAGMPGAQAVMAQFQTTCAYCNSVYLLNEQSRCPNCGAPTG